MNAREEKERDRESQSGRVGFPLDAGVRTTRSTTKRELTLGRMLCSAE